MPPAFRRILREDLPALALVSTLLLATAWAVMRSGWASGLSVLPAVILIALAASYLLALSRFSEAFCALLALFYGLFSVWVLVSQQIAAPLSLRARLLELAFRLDVWLEQALGGGYSRDTLIFVLLAALLAWLLTFGAVWNALRLRRLWPAVIPTGIALLVNLYYYTGTAPLHLPLLAYLAAVFMLAVHINATAREQLWQQARAAYQPAARAALLRGGLAAVIVLVALAWLAPPASASNRLSTLWQRSNSPLRDVQDTFDRLFGALESPAQVAPSYYAGPMLTMGGPVTLGSSPVMQVYAPEGYRYYWRSKIFHSYASGTWWTEADARLTAAFGQLPAESDDLYQMRRNVLQRFEISMPATYALYAAPQPLAFASIPISFDVLYTSADSDDFATVTLAEARTALLAGDSYSVTSSISIADEASLRAAGTDYPAWVRERYLALPDSITARTRALAAELAAPHSSPYDVARAAETYLRGHITYNSAVAAPPPDVEPVDYVLFEQPEGYCTYYASAMAVLLRAAGIPARVAAGFAQGAFDPQQNAYVVLESDAHAWVEVYFPRYGWIDFEPTAAQQPILRDERFQPFEPEALGSPPQPAPPQQPAPADPGSDSPSAATGAPAAAPLHPSPLKPLLRWLAVTLIAGAVAVLGARQWLSRRGLLGASEVTRSYAWLNLAAPLADVDLHPGDTPYERAEAFRRAIPRSEQPVRRIIELYVQEQYTPQRIPPAQRLDAARQARGAWQAARRILLRAALVRRVTLLNPLARRGITIR